jgi:hypothetical protein
MMLMTIKHCPGLGPSMHIHESRDFTLSKHMFTD